MFKKFILVVLFCITLLALIVLSIKNEGQEFELTGNKGSEKFTINVACVVSIFEYVEFLDTISITKKHDTNIKSISLFKNNELIFNKQYISEIEQSGRSINHKLNKFHGKYEVSFLRLDPGIYEIKYELKHNGTVNLKIVPFHENYCYKFRWLE